MFPRIERHRTDQWKGERVSLSGTGIQIINVNNKRRAKETAEQAKGMEQSWLSARNTGNYL
jgi:hypothetical protein